MSTAQEIYRPAEQQPTFELVTDTMWYTMADIPVDFRGPETVDVNVNGICNLNCPWCWGPEHSLDIETVTKEQWLGLFDNLQAVGTRSLVFSGGETLMKPELPELLAHAAAIGMRNTLSTNGILLPNKHETVLPFVADLGIPLDGPTEEINAQMRVPLGRKPRHAGRAIRSLQIAQELYPDIDLTVRTVVAKPNLAHIAQIGKVLVQNGIDGSKLRWKLYQCTPTGPRQDEILSGDWLITDDEFTRAVDEVNNANLGFTHISTQSIHDRESRYFFVFPDGSSSISGEQYGVTLTGNPLYEETPTGDVVANFAGVMHVLEQLDYSASKHGTSVAMA